MINIKLGECKFCEKLVELCQAHIIPQALVRNKAKGSKKGLFYIDEKGNYSIVKSNGYYDRNILCNTCDGKFGAYEEALIKFLKDSDCISKYNYRKISLAIEFILWKSHLTTLPDYEDINLGKY